jgi:four helix bundle protein
VKWCWLDWLVGHWSLESELASAKLVNHQTRLSMPRANPVQEKSFRFALDVVRLYGALRDRREYELGRQVLRSGTAIGANVEEALAAVSRPDFIAKMSIASREARECRYWLRLLGDSDLAETASLLCSCTELVHMLTAIVKTAQRGPRPITPDP